jgi:C1A family cysteine protease
MSKYGYIKDQPDTRDYRVTRAVAPVKLPAVLDYTDQMTGIENQYNEGTCVAFASVAVKEYQEKKEWKTDNDFSKRYLYQECKKIDDIPDEEGTYPRCAMKVLLNKGVPPESCWRYLPNIIGTPCKNADALAMPNRIEGYWRVDDNIDAIKESLYLNGPMVVGIDVYESFENASDGIVPMPKNGEELLGGHAICLVGFDDKKKLLKFKNSWGIIWGDTGYGYLPYDYVDPYLYDAWACRDFLGEPREPTWWEKIVAWFKSLFSWWK